MGVLSRGDIVQGILSRGDIVRGDVVRGMLSGGMLSGGILSRGYCPGGYCPRTLIPSVLRHTYARTGLFFATFALRFFLTCSKFDHAFHAHGDRSRSSYVLHVFCERGGSVVRSCFGVTGV